MMPCPQKMIGRSAASMSSAARAHVFVAGPVLGAVPGQAHRAAVPHEVGVDACCASLVMSTSTGPRPARARDVERLPQRGRDVLDARDEVVVLGDRQRDAGDVGLLEGVAADELRRRPAR